MTDENLAQNDAAEEPQDEKNDTGRALMGKIARLPNHTEKIELMGRHLFDKHWQSRPVPAA